MTAAERLRQLAGFSGTAAALLLAIGTGATAGEALNNYSSIDSGTAAEHLLSETSASTGWDTSQGVANKLFTPVTHTAAIPSTSGSFSGTGVVDVEGRFTTVASFVGMGVRASSGSPWVQTSSVGVAYGAGGYSGTWEPVVSTSALAVVRSCGGESGASPCTVSCSAEADSGSTYGLSCSTSVVDVFTVKNPTDEEILLLLLTR